MEPEPNPDAWVAPEANAGASPRPHALSTLAPTIAVLAVAVAALAAAVMSMRPEAEASAGRPLAAASATEVVRAPPLNRMGAAPACRACGVVESVAAVKGAKGFQMRIRMDDGSLRTVEQRGAMAAGTRVVVEGGAVKLIPGPG